MFISPIRITLYNYFLCTTGRYYVTGVRLQDCATDMQDVSHYKLFSYTGALIKWNRQTCLQLRLRRRARSYTSVCTTTDVYRILLPWWIWSYQSYHDYSKRPKNSQHRDTRVYYIWSKLNKELNDVTNSCDI